VPSPRCTGVGAAYVGSPAWDEFIKCRVERNTLPGRIRVAAARSLESVMRSRYPDFRAKDAGGAAALMLGRGKNAVMLERMLIAIVRQAAVDPVQLPRDRVFLTLVVLPAKLTLGVSNQDQIHHLSDSPAPSCNPKTRRCRQSPGVRVRCRWSNYNGRQDFVDSRKRAHKLAYFLVKGGAKGIRTPDPHTAGTGQSG
jgi:hypothetical protein